MNLEENIKDVIAKKLEDGVVEQLVSEKLEEGINNALGHLFGSYGDVTQIIEKQVKSVMVPYLERYDYSKYIVKLDDVLTEVLKESTNDNRQILENFKGLMASDKEFGKEMKATELFEEWMEYVSENIDTSDLEINYDEEPRYENAEVSLRFEEDESNYSWSSVERASLIFECETDENMNVRIPLSRWKTLGEKNWSIDYKSPNDLSSLRYLNSFEVYMMRVVQSYVKLVVDVKDDQNEVEINDVPEADFY